MTQPTHSDEFCERCWSFDPLAATRGPADPPLDVITTGPVFFDIIFSGLPRIPQPGEELWSKGMGSCPGGIANLATALARLGLRAGLVAGFGDDAYADWMWETLLEHEHINLATSPRFRDFHTALTIAMTVGGDRAMCTHGHEPPESLGKYMLAAPASRVAVVDLRGDTDWWGELRVRGTTLFADIGFDESERWDPADLEPLRHCHAFTPNALEAMAYTRTDSPTKAVHKLAERVPFAVVTDGVGGSYAIDQTTDEEAWCPAISVDVIDATGAGDVFASGLVLGTLAGWPLEQRLRFASLTASLAVQQFGGSLAAPGWGDIADWWRSLRRLVAEGDLRAACISRDYGFLEDLIPRHRVHSVRRAEATFAAHSDLPARRY